jgi:hypothetical protein
MIEEWNCKLRERERERERRMFWGNEIKDDRAD